MADRLLDNPVEYLLRHRRVAIAATPVLRQRRGIEDRIGQPQPQEPAIGNVDLDLADKLPFRANPKQIAKEQRLEHQCRIQRRPTIVSTVKRRRQLVNERKINHRVDLAQQVIRRNQLVECHYLERSLLRSRLSQHSLQNHKPPAHARGLSAV